MNFCKVTNRFLPMRVTGTADLQELDLTLVGFTHRCIMGYSWLAAQSPVLLKEALTMHKKCLGIYIVI